MIKEALMYIADLKAAAMTPQVLEIDGKTYCTKDLKRYDKENFASEIKAATLTAMVDYIKNCSSELRDHMIIHVVSPTRVKLYSGLTKERERETLFVAEAVLPSFRFDSPYDQERFVIELQADFVMTQPLAAVLRVAGNVESSTTAHYGDDGIAQKTTINQGIASKVDVIVPNPVTLKPYRTFFEVDQPESEFVFRISDDHGRPVFKLVEAEGGIWKNEAMHDIREFFMENLEEFVASGQITVIA